MTNLNIANLDYFVARIGKMDFFPLLKTNTYETNIKPRIIDDSFIPDDLYLKNLLDTNVYFSFIIDDKSFYSFVSDIQTISTLHFESKIRKAWKKYRNSPFYFCVFSSDDKFRSKINNEEKNLLDRNHLENIKIEIYDLPNRINQPADVIIHYIEYLQKKIHRDEISVKRGKELRFIKVPDNNEN